MEMLVIIKIDMETENLDLQARAAKNVKKELANIKNRNMN